MPNNVIELVVKVTDQATAQLRGISARIGPILGRAAVAGSLLFGVALRAIIKATKESQAATAQLDAAYRATGAGLGRTREQLDALATQMQRTTVYEDDLVKGAQAILLTFDKVRGDAFERTIKVSADLAARLGTDLTSAVRTLGIALQDPEQGMVRLRRAGVLFTEAQQKTIKGFTDLGQTAKAQAFILSEVERRFHGAAAAARNTLGGALQGLGNAFGDLLEVSEKSTSGAVKSINSLTETLQDPAIKSALDSIFGAMIQGAALAVEAIAGVTNAFRGLFGFVSSQERLKGIKSVPWLADLISKQTEDRINQVREALAKFQGIDPRTLTGAARLAFDDLRKSLVELEAIQKQLQFGTTGGPLTRGGNRQAQIAGPLLEIEEVVVTATKIVKTATEQLYADIEEKTRTTTQKLKQEWVAFQVDVQESLDRGTISAKDAVARLAEKLDELLPEVVVTVKRIDAGPLRELSATAKRVAENIQDAFASAFRSIFEGDKPRNILANFLRAFAEIPVQLAAERFAARMRKALEPAIERLFDPGKAARAAETARIGEAAFGGGSPAQQQAAKIVEQIKANAQVVQAVTTGAAQTVGKIAEQTAATTTAAQSLCECICACLGALKDSLAGGPDAVVGAILNQTDAGKTVAKSAATDVVTGVDQSVKVSTQAITNKLTEVANFLVPKRDTALGSALRGIGSIVSAVGDYKAKNPKDPNAKAGGGMASGRTLVGEEGPEVVDLPAGSRVTNQRQAAFGGGAKLNFAPAYNITISGGDNPKAAQQALLGYLQLQDGKQKKWVLDLMRTNFGRVVTP